ncbi:partitioning defective 3 homolog [Nasonia vitripennis]|uniref:PDZ domain-containing protein n=1 Tax=Nasonia vitripennis TaxID=7425 RepID=A0A7M7GCC0_NASVI|nr:partitioning defective 3 homolog [Nasonia vitripennis]
MKVTVCFDHIRVVVPCGDGSLLVRDLMHEAMLRYKKATGKSDSTLTINSLSSLTGGGILDPDDRLCDVADDREQIVAHFAGSDVVHAGGDGASSVGTNSPDFFHTDTKEHRMYTSRSTGNIKRESTKRLSMHVLSSREPCLTTYSALSLPRESRRKEPLGQDAKALYEMPNLKPDLLDQGEICEIIIKNEAGPLGLHVVPCYDLLGNDQGLRVEGIEPNGRIAKDGQIDLHDKIIRINGHNLLRIPFSKVQEIFRSCMNESCLKISVLKHKKSPQDKNIQKTLGTSSSSEKTGENDDSIKRLQCANYNVLQTANTRKIGKMIEIELTKGNNGLGFSVTTRDNPAGGHCPIYIKNILPKGAAVEDGRLKPGDRLLEVNNLEMTGKSQAEVVALLRSIPPGGKVRLVVSRQEEVCANTSDTPDTSKNWKSPQDSPTKKKEEAEAYDKCNYKTTQVANDVVLSPRKNRMILTLDIPVHDSEKAGLGVSVKGKTSTAEDSSNTDLGIFIKSVLHGGAASRDGRLRTNDQLLLVNGVSLVGLSNSDAMETLRRAMFNTNSSITGVIQLVIARRLSSYDTSSNSEKNFSDKVSPSTCKDSSSSVFIMNSNTKQNDGHVKEKNNLNSQTDILDNSLLAASASPWNPVIDRLTEQYNKNSLRNESYCIATNKTWMDPVSIAKKLSIGQRDDHLKSVLAEESNENSHSSNTEPKKSADDKDSQYSGDPAYDSQLSLEEFTSPTNKFSRDALGRQSMSEKRHAALDAKNTDTYKRNKKIREGRDNNNKSDEQKNHSKDYKADSFGTTNSSKSSIGESSKHSQPEYLYTIPGPGSNNKLTLPRKHWLVDDVHTAEVSNSSNNKEDQGFTNARGDIKQASLNSALDDRYKRSRRKGIRSMLRLGKNRKSLNFGDNIENRHESTFQPIRRSVFTQQKRFRGKINIQRPRPPHHERGKVLKFITPFISNPDTQKPLKERCKRISQTVMQKTKPINPYDVIIARECLNWFKTSRMVAILHANSIKSEQQFEYAVPLKRANMYFKGYQPSILNLALKDSNYEAVLKLCLPTMPVSYFVFSPETNVPKLVQITKRTPQLILMAGILDGKFLRLNDFIKYGSLDLVTAQAGLVQVLRTAAGGNLNQQLTHHQSTLVTRLKQICTKEEDKPCDANE